MNHIASIQPACQSTVQSQVALAIGLDIGGTKLSAAHVHTTQGMAHFSQTATPAQGPVFLEAIVGLVTPLLNQPSSDGLKPSCLGIASAGTVNSQTGEIFGSTGNLPALKDIGPLKQELEAVLGIPVFIENDANAAAYGEVCLGAAKGAQNVLMITLGTGIGAGLIINGQLIRGAHFAAAEAGHICISNNQERLCTCGKWDCWEAFACGGGFARLGELMLEKHSEDARQSSLASHQGALTTHQIVEAWRQKDALAIAIHRQWHADIAVGLGSLLNVLDPELTVVGGGLAEAVDLPLLITLTHQRTMIAEPPVIRLAELGNRSGIVGAAWLALERVV